MKSAATADNDDGDIEDEDGAKRGVQYRQFIKEKLMGHRIWHDGSYWEQALWQCALEQVLSSLFFLVFLLLIILYGFICLSYILFHTISLGTN